MVTQMEICHVFALSNGVPSFWYQDANTGYWYSAGNPIASEPTWPQFTDLCMGRDGQGWLRVGYTGTDGKIYTNWEDPNANWGTHGPLP